MTFILSNTSPISKAMSFMMLLKHRKFIHCLKMNSFVPFRFQVYSTKPNHSHYERHILAIVTQNPNFKLKYPSDLYVNWIFFGSCYKIRLKSLSLFPQFPFSLIKLMMTQIMWSFFGLFCLSVWWGSWSERMWAPYSFTGVDDSNEAANDTTEFFENRRSQGASELLLKRCSTTAPF